LVWWRSFLRQSLRSWHSMPCLRPRSADWGFCRRRPQRQWSSFASACRRAEVISGAGRRPRGSRLLLKRFRRLLGRRRQHSRLRDCGKRSARPSSHLAYWPASGCSVRHGV